jgi:hypothetical protein
VSVLRFLTLAVALTACAPAGGPGGGLYGLVTRGPTAPVCRVGTPCTGPAGNTTLLFVSTAGTTRVRTTAKGRYTIALAPGVYTVRTTQRGIGGVRPSRVRVTRGAFAHQNFFVDTGIR